MAFVVAEPCIKCKYTHCVAVCPVDSFREADEYLVIEPEVCIDCGACVPECPSEAIYSEQDLPPHWRYFTKRNAELAPVLPVITHPGKPLPDAEAWKILGKGNWRELGQKASTKKE